MKAVSGGTGDWVVQFICCGYDDGTWRCPTWQAADELRNSYIDAEGHERSARIIEGPRVPFHELADAVLGPAPTPEEHRAP